MLKSAVLSDVHYDPYHHAIQEEILKNLQKESIDVLFLVGDFTAKQIHLDIYFGLVRQYFPKAIIITVFGNHDYRDKVHKNACTLEGTVPEKIKNRLYIGPIPQWENHISFQKEMCQKYNIIRLDSESYQLTEKTIILGFDGWYGSETEDFPSLDYTYLPDTISGIPAYQYMHQKFQQDFARVMKIDTTDKFTVTLTHFPPFSRNTSQIIDVGYTPTDWGGDPAMLEPLTSKSDLLLFGHNHAATDVIYNDCRLLNPGSVHGKRFTQGIMPNFKIFYLE